MTVFTTIADVILNSMIIAAAGYLVWLAARHLWSTDDRTPVSADPVIDPRYWDVLAEARRITENGA